MMNEMVLWVGSL